MNKITEIDVIGWSLGGIKYLCFDEIIKEQSNNIKIRYVYLFEPLLTIRSILDVYVSHKRSFFKTIRILNKRTFNLSTKYKFYNILMSYILHSHLVVSAANSSHFLYHAEHKKSLTKTINNNRYLFLSVITTFRAPTKLHIAIDIRPIGPAPVISTSSPTIS